jgi:hypothetical protein
MYDAQQGATSGAQIDANTGTGTNKWHGQVFGSFANNSLNAAPFFFKQEYLLSAQQGVGAFPASLANPWLQRWSSGASLGGPVLKDKLFFFGVSARGQRGPGDWIDAVDCAFGADRRPFNTGLENALTSWYDDGKTHSDTSAQSQQRS